MSKKTEALEVILGLMPNAKFIDKNGKDVTEDVKKSHNKQTLTEQWQELNKQRNKFIRNIKDLAYIHEENKQLKKWVEEFNVLNVAQENQKLKELLEECQHYIVNTPVYPQGDNEKQKEIHILLDKIDEVFE